MLALAAVGAVIVFSAAAYPVLSGRTDPPRFTQESATRELGRARKTSDGRWAKGHLALAEAAMRAAINEHRLQESRFFLLRDFAKTRASFLLAEERARAAAEEASRQKKWAVDAAEQSLARAAEAVDTADGIADQMHLGVYSRLLLQRSKLALEEARILQANSEPVRSAARAADAEQLARHVHESVATQAARFADAGLVRRWRTMIQSTIGWSRDNGEAAIIVNKENHRLQLYVGGRLVRTYRAELGYNSVRDKQSAGDAATPEGSYRITAKKTSSTYYKALLLNYPNEEDLAEFSRAKRAGRLPRGARVGGLIEIHGDGGRGKDWTKGCVALANDDIDDLFRRVVVGTPVTIVGGDGSGGTYTEIVRRHRATTNGTSKM
jgi:lipoprotein-anchoring transpeptidase ErfK/SrfK